MAARASFTWIALAVSLTACGERVGLGGEDKSDLVAPKESCGGKECGEPCSSAPCTADSPCDGDAPSGTCDENGACNAWTPACVFEPCAGLSCGDPCATCDFDDPTCAVDDQLYTCDEHGYCRPGANACPCLPGEDCGGECFGAPCGMPCDPCAPDDPSCLGGMAYCDDFGTCLRTETPTCDPCFGKLCGEWCGCVPGDANCELGGYLCNMNGICTTAYDVTTCEPDYNPCATLQQPLCGEPCSPCDPLSKSCVQPDIPFFCDAGLECRPFYPQTCDKDCAAEGLPCGAQCGFCDQGAFNNPDPDPPFCKPKFCDDYSMCLAPEVIHCGGLNGCTDSGKQCGEICSLCDPARMTCAPEDVFLTCNAFNECSADGPTCGVYQACANHVCGQPCDYCAPGDVDCIAPSGTTFCDSNGACIEPPFQCQ